LTSSCLTTTLISFSRHISEPRCQLDRTFNLPCPDQVQKLVCFQPPNLSPPPRPPKPFHPNCSLLPHRLSACPFIMFLTTSQWTLLCSLLFICNSQLCSRWHPISSLPPHAVTHVPLSADKILNSNPLGTNSVISKFFYLNIKNMILIKKSILHFFSYKHINFAINVILCRATFACFFLPTLIIFVISFPFKYAPVCLLRES